MKALRGELTKGRVEQKQRSARAEAARAHAQGLEACVRTREAECERMRQWVESADARVLSANGERDAAAARAHEAEQKRADEAAELHSLRISVGKCRAGERKAPAQDTVTTAPRMRRLKRSLKDSRLSAARRRS
eukprot:4190021-Pleurochrysis_carterae.AAC.1